MSQAAAEVSGRQLAGGVVQLSLLVAAATMAIYARTTVGPLQEAIRIGLSLTDNQIALLQGPALAVPLVTMAVPLGLAIDRYSRVRLMCVFASLNFVGSLGTAIAPNFLVLIVARCLIGLTGTTTLTAAISLISDLYDSGHRGRATMLLTIGAVGGMSGCFALGGELLAIYGSAPNGWRWAMLWMSVPLLPVILLTLAIREPLRTGSAALKPSWREAFAEFRHYRAIVIPLAAGLIMAVTADGASTIWTAPTLSRRFGLTPDRIGSIMAMVLLVSGVVGPILGGVLADVCQRGGGPRRTMYALAGLALISAPAGLFPILPGTESIALSFVTFMTIGVAFNVAVPALTTIVIPNELRGLCLTLMTAICMLAAFGLAPVIVSLLSNVLGGPAEIGKALALVCVITSMISAAAFAFGSRSFPALKNGCR